MATIALPGLDRLRAWIRGDLSTTPIEHLTGIVPVEAGVGTMTFAMPASEWLMSGSRFFLGGSLALLADAPLACAIITGLPPGVGLTTQELSMHFLRVASPESRRLTARGHIIHGGRSIGLSEVHINDADGRLIAYGSSRCVTFEVQIPAELPTYERPEPNAHDWLPPNRRPVQGAVTARDVLATLSGAELVAGWSDATLPLPPICLLFGMRPMGGKEGAATVEMVASPALRSAFPIWKHNAQGQLPRPTTSDSSPLLALAGLRRMNFPRLPALADLRLAIWFAFRKLPPPQFGPPYIKRTEGAARGPFS